MDKGKVEETITNLIVNNRYKGHNQEHKNPRITTQSWQALYSYTGDISDASEKDETFLAITFPEKVKGFGSTRSPWQWNINYMSKAQRQTHTTKLWLPNKLSDQDFLQIRIPEY